MATYEEEITVVSSKGQVVLPLSLREKLGLKPKTKLLVYSYKDSIIMKKMKIPDMVRDLKSIYKNVDARIAKYGELSEKEIQREIEEYRSEKRKKHKDI